MRNPVYDLKPNPHTTVTLERDRGIIKTIKIQAPVRKQSLRLSTITRESEPELFNVLLMRQIAGAKGWNHHFPEILHSRLTEIGVLLPEHQVSNPVSFC